MMNSNSIPSNFEKYYLKKYNNFVEYLIEYIKEHLNQSSLSNFFPSLSQSLINLKINKYSKILNDIQIHSDIEIKMLFFYMYKFAIYCDENNYNIKFSIESYIAKEVFLNFIDHHKTKSPWLTINLNFTFITFTLKNCYLSKLLKCHYYRQNADIYLKECTSLNERQNLYKSLEFDEILFNSKFSNENLQIGRCFIHNLIKLCIKAQQYNIDKIKLATENLHNNLPPVKKPILQNKKVTFARNAEIVYYFGQQFFCKELLEKLMHYDVISQDSKLYKYNVSPVFNKNLNSSECNIEIYYCNKIFMTKELVDCLTKSGLLESNQIQPLSNVITPDDLKYNHLLNINGDLTHLAEIYENRNSLSYVSIVTSKNRSQISLKYSVPASANDRYLKFTFNKLAVNNSK